MTIIPVQCPHCNQELDLKAVITPTVGAALLEELGIVETERSRIRDEIIAEMAQAHRLEILETEKLISDLRAGIRDLQLKATRGSQQRAGEALELEILRELRNRFPEDDLVRVGKGRNGADIIHRIFDDQRHEIGSILWEIKNTATWSPKWLDKIRNDAARCNAQLCAIVSASLPKGLLNFGEVGGVWISNLECHIGLALALRSQLCICSTLRQTLGNVALLDSLKHYILSAEFTQRVTAITTAVSAIQAQIEREKHALERHWSERQKLATSIGENIATLSGGIAGLSRIDSHSVTNTLLPLTACVELPHELLSEGV